eukprot:11193535-Lingulodinium_polyedra.AAC.1
MLGHVAFALEARRQALGVLLEQYVPVSGRLGQRTALLTVTVFHWSSCDNGTLDLYTDAVLPWSGWGHFRD